MIGSGKGSCDGVEWEDYRKWPCWLRRSIVRGNEDSDLKEFREEVSRRSQTKFSELDSGENENGFRTPTLDKGIDYVLEWSFLCSEILHLRFTSLRKVRVVDDSEKRGSLVSIYRVLGFLWCVKMWGDENHSSPKYYHLKVNLCVIY